MKALVRLSLCCLLMAACSDPVGDPCANTVICVAEPDAAGVLDATVDSALADAVAWPDTFAPDTVVADHRQADGAAGGDGGVPDPCTPAAVAAAVSTDRLRTALTDLTSLPERSSWSGQRAALAALQGRLTDLGVSFRTLDYDISGQTWSNIEIDIQGRSGDAYYIAGAHYDAVATVDGADDDGSGSAAIVELATVLGACSFNRTIKLALFFGEESGRLGSSRFASAATQRGDTIAGMLSLDMIGYGEADEDLDVVTKPIYSGLADDVLALGQPHTPIVMREVIDQSCG